MIKSHIYVYIFENIIPVNSVFTRKGKGIFSITIFMVSTHFSRQFETEF